MMNETRMRNNDFFYSDIFHTVCSEIIAKILLLFKISEITKLKIIAF